MNTKVNYRKIYYDIKRWFYTHIRKLFVPNKTRKPNGYVLYSGPSLLDGKPIIVVAILKSSNRKTGGVVQTYILREDINPLHASKTGQDYSICGNCIMRGTPTTDPKRKQAKDRPCYVTLGQGPEIVWKQYHKGAYPLLTSYDDIASIGKFNTVRLGTYGDPASVPSYIWYSLVSRATLYLGYSHQANVEEADYRPDLCMRSADSLEEARTAWDKGERTFRVITDLSERVEGKEIVCPAPRVTCNNCGLCGGNQIKAKNIVIVAHGTGSKYIR